MSAVIPFPARTEPKQFQFVGVEIWKGTWQGDPTPRWFIAGIVNDGSEVILNMKLSHAEAIRDARESSEEFDVGVTDRS